MQRHALDRIENEPHPMGVNTVRKSLASAFSLDYFSSVYYELDPGESFSGGLHTHHDQEELFYVIEGTATFEIREDPDGSSTKMDVKAGECIHFEPGDVFQMGVNESEEQVVALAIAGPGAQHEWDAIEAIVYCPDCGEETSQGVALVSGSLELTCNVCGTVQG
jgi:mannose-6-phosphate isomerase-like protein (cupin superfamily)